MKKRTLFISILFIFLYKSKAQFSEKQSFVYKEASYDIFIIKQDSLLANKCSFIDNKNLKGEKDFFMSLPKKSFFAITASIIDSNCNPLGLFVKDGIKIKDLNTTKQGNGSFYAIQPNGIFFITQNNEVNVASSPDFQSTINLKLAIQTGPMLVNNSIINSNFTIVSKNKYIRCGVGIYANNDGRYIVFAKSNEPVNFYDFADLFLSKYNCTNALNLESGTNSSIHLPSQSVLRFKNNIRQCRYFSIEMY